MKVRIGFGKFGLVFALLIAILHLPYGSREWVPAPANYWVGNAAAQMADKIPPTAAYWVNPAQYAAAGVGSTFNCVYAGCQQEVMVYTFEPNLAGCQAAGYNNVPAYAFSWFGSGWSIAWEVVSLTNGAVALGNGRYLYPFCAYSGSDAYIQSAQQLNSYGVFGSSCHDPNGSDKGNYEDLVNT